jgi:hypothetical protein
MSGWVADGISLAALAQPELFTQTSLPHTPIIGVGVYTKAASF